MVLVPEFKLFEVCLNSDKKQIMLARAAAIGIMMIPNQKSHLQFK